MSKMLKGLTLTKTEPQMPFGHYTPNFWEGSSHGRKEGEDFYVGFFKAKEMEDWGGIGIYILQKRGVE